MSEAVEAIEEEDDGWEELYGLNDQLVSDVEEACEEEKAPEELQALIDPLHVADLADLLEQLSSSAREYVIGNVGENFDAELWVHLDESVREDIVDELDTEQLVEIVNELDSDDAIDLIEDLDEAEQRELLDAVPADDRVLYEQSLSYPEDSAGRLMQREVVTVPSFWSVGQTIDYMRDETNELPDDFYNLVVIDPTHCPVGIVKLSKLLRTSRDNAVTDLMWEDVKVIPVSMDQEDVAFLFRHYGLVEAPVVDDNGRLLGVITVDDIVDELDTEQLVE
ncbi:MAG: CBS domain-containing protein, partial [Alphaproteobacteria bacterium]|nr:CBS domain-containing protein [Alphaproteobacteria bacterium]